MPRHDSEQQDRLGQLLAANRQREAARRRIQERIATRVRPAPLPDVAEPFSQRMPRADEINNWFGSRMEQAGSAPQPQTIDPSAWQLPEAQPQPRIVIRGSGNAAHWADPPPPTAPDVLPVGILRTREVAPHDTTVITERWDGEHWRFYSEQPREAHENEMRWHSANEYQLPYHDPHGTVAIPARPSDVGRPERLYREEVDGTIHVDEVSMPSDTTLGRPRSRTNSRLPQEPGYIQTVRTIISSQKCNLRLVKHEHGFTLGITSPRNTNGVDLINIRENRHREADPRGFTFMRIPIRGDRFAHGMQLVERSHEDYGTQIVVKEIKGE